MRASKTKPTKEFKVYINTFLLLSTHHSNWSCFLQRISAPPHIASRVEKKTFEPAKYTWKLDSLSIIYTHTHKVADHFTNEWIIAIILLQMIIIQNLYTCSHLHFSSKNLMNDANWTCFVIKKKRGKQAHCCQWSTTNDIRTFYFLSVWLLRLKFTTLRKTKKLVHVFFMETERTLLEFCGIINQKMNNKVMKYLGS